MDMVSPRSDSSSFLLHLNTHSVHTHTQIRMQAATHLGSVLEREGAALGELHEVVVHEHLPHALRHRRQLPAQSAGQAPPRESLNERREERYK